MHFPEVEKRWESEEPGIVERLSGGRKFISIAFFLVLLLYLLFPVVSRAANIRIVGGELFENLRSMCQNGDLGGLTAALEGHLPQDRVTSGGAVRRRGNRHRSGGSRASGLSLRGHSVAPGTGRIVIPPRISCTVLR